MYDNFAEVTPRGKGRRAGQRMRSKPASEASDRAPIENVETTIPSFEPGVRYGPYMLEQDNALTPVFQIVSESDGLVESRQYMHPGISLILGQGGWQKHGSRHICPLGVRIRSQDRRRHRGTSGVRQPGVRRSVRAQSDVAGAGPYSESGRWAIG